MSNALLEVGQFQINQRLDEESTSSIVKTHQGAEVYYYSEQQERLTAVTVSSRSRTAISRKHSIVEQYFNSDSEGRLESRKRTAAKIKSFDAVFAVLDWSLRGDVVNAHDAAVDLLAECNVILVSATQYCYLEYSRTNKGGNQLDLDTKLDVLVNGLARASKLSAELRLKAVIQLAGSKSRVVKAAVIDAAAMLVNRRNKKSVQALLQWFTSNKEADQYIRQYAEEVLSDIT